MKVCEECSASLRYNYKIPATTKPKYVEQGLSAMEGVWKEGSISYWSMKYKPALVGPNKTTDNPYLIRRM